MKPSVCDPETRIPSRVKAPAWQPREPGLLLCTDESFIIFSLLGWGEVVSLQASVI